MTQTRANERRGDQLQQYAASTSGTTRMGAAQGARGASAPSMGSLTPESLLAYCQIQLQALDGEMMTRMNDQSRSITTRQKISDACGKMSSCPAARNEERNQLEVAYSPERGAAAAELRDAAAMMMPTDEQRAKLLEYADKLADPNQPFDAEQWKNIQDEIEGVGNSLGDQAQLAMIELQSLMAKRQTAIQLTTNILGKVDESMKTVAQNI